jgi:hypothetical protein
MLAVGPACAASRGFLRKCILRHHNRFDGHVWYEVDRQTGHVELTIDGATLAVAGDAEARIKAACAGR